MSDSGPTISENATDAADSSVTFNHSAAAMSMRAMPTSQYLVGTGKADITGAAETGMFGYAAGQVVQGINDRLYSHAFIIGEVDKNAGKRVLCIGRYGRVVYCGKT
nr:neutral/alkaline non-lysosomal ceramidase N-terminal domain-containing protein [uncultured Psychrobacter sp.]